MRSSRLLTLLPLLAVHPATASPGMVLPTAPSVPPGVLSPPPADPLALARARWQEGDAAGVIGVLSPWLGGRRGPGGRTRASAQLLLGMAELQLENWNLASSAFYQVRRTDGPLAPFGAWYEALVDHKRGRQSVAIRECTDYRTKWPEGPQADECLLLIGDAWAESGSRGSALASYQAYLTRHPDTPREEEIQLAIAQATANANPARGAQLLIQLILEHSYPSTELGAREALGELTAAGLEASVPEDPTSRMRYTESLRRSGQNEAAWERFQALAAEAGSNPQIAEWVDTNEERFSWGTRQYDVYANALAKDYEAAPSGELAWRIFRAWRRDGGWEQALEWAHRAEADHKDSRSWRGSSDDIAWATLHGGAYAEAATRFAAIADRGGKSRARYRFFHAYSLLQAGQPKEALEAFDTLLSRPGDFAAAGHYWRAKAHAALGEEAAAAADRAAAVAADETGWYALLLEHSSDEAIDAGWSLRDGRWHGAALTSLPPWSRPLAQPVTAVKMWPGGYGIAEIDGVGRVGLEIPTRSGDLSLLGWAQLSGRTPNPTQEEAGPVTLSVVSSALPDGYAASPWFDPAQTQRDFERFADDNSSAAPDLPAAYDLAMAGLYTEAAILLSKSFEDWRRARESPAPTGAQLALRAMTVSTKDWRQFFLFVRDHYHAAWFSMGLAKQAEDEVQAVAAWRLRFPVVRAKEIWDHSQRFNVDPYLVLGIMRQESRYKADAMSPVGAVGLVQVMPRTGARVAAMLGETHYSPGALADPEVNLRYGVYYLSRLLDRFDGVFPLAVASYNGGPHNVSRWYAHWAPPDGAGIELDALVEQIEYDETRDYVKKVSGNYARYVELYEPEGAQVLLPTRARGDDAGIIDF